MSLVSLACLRFALVVAAAYFIFPKKLQWLVLFVANIYFYCSYGAGYITYLVFAAIVSYTGALILERINRQGSEAISGAKDDAEKDRVRSRNILVKKRAAFIIISLIMVFWLILKYGRFVLNSLTSLFSVFTGAAALSAEEIILPLGMSFYTFHAIGYVVDVYRKKYPAEKNILKYFTFLAFFPHMVEGPFSRYNDLGRTLFAQNRFSYERLCEGSARILWGVFKKVVVGDSTASTVNMILLNYADYTGVQIIFAIVLYSIRLYADFSGYMDMACGFCHILGIELAENFKQPFFAKTVDEYWRRWHITLGKWFRDYVFYPASMSRNGMGLSKWARQKWGAKTGKVISGYFAMFFVWTATGLWHGANWTFLAWGYLNLIVMCSTMQLSDTYEKAKNRLNIKSESFLWKAFCMFRTYLLISSFRFFSVAPDLSSAVGAVVHTLIHPGFHMLLKPSGFFVGMYREEIILAIIGMAAIVAVDILNEKGLWDKCKKGAPVIVRAIAYAAMIVLIAIMIKGDDISRGFMYANF